MADPLKIVVWINEGASRHLSEADRGLALVRGRCDGQNMLVCDVIAVTDVWGSISISFETVFGVYAAPPSAAPIKPLQVLRPVLRDVAHRGRIYQFDGTRFTALQNAPSPDVIGVIYRPLAPATQRIVVGLTELVGHQDGQREARPPISGAVLGANETVFLPLPAPEAYIFTQSGMSVGLVLSGNLLVRSGSPELRDVTIVMGRPLAVPLSAAKPAEVHFDLSSNTFMPGPYPTSRPTFRELRPDLARSDDLRVDPVPSRL